MSVKEENLIKYIPDSYIVRSVDNPNSNYNISIKCDYFTKNLNITENNFITLLKNKEIVSIKDVINFFENNTKYNNNNTKGKYHELMPLTHAIYNVIIENDLPKYLEIHEKIKPMRIEFLICWWINHIIQNDNFLQKYLDYIKPSYQTYIDNRFYDIEFNKLDIIIEIQEDSSAHEENNNDITKESLIRIRSKRIIYFKCSEYYEDNYQYLDKFSNDLKKGLIASLLSKDKEIREKYCIYRFMNMIEEEKKITNKKSKLSYLNRFTEVSSMISKMFIWKDKASDANNNNKYVIPIENIQFITKFTNIDELLEIIDSKYDSKDGCITWKILNKLINLNSKMKDIDKETILEYLLSVEDIYQEICDLIIFHGNECIKNNINHFELYDNHTKKKYDNEISKLKSKYETQLNKLNSELSENNKLIKSMKKSIDKVDKLIDTYIDDKRNSKKLHNLLQFSNEITNIKKDIQIDKSFINIKINKTIGSSILIGKQNLPIIYTNCPKDFIYKDIFFGICIAHKLTITQINSIIEELIPTGCSSKKTRSIPYIKILKVDTTEEKKELEDETNLELENETNLELEDETNLESKYESELDD